MNHLPNPNAVTSGLPPELEDQIQGLAHASFMLPAAARKAMELAKDPNCDVEDFLVVIQRDPKLAHDILCIANSAAFNSNKKIASLQQAVVRLGFRQCRNLILAAAFSSLMASWPEQQQDLRNDLWKHSFTTALFSQRLNRIFRIGFEGEEFTAGLIHDFGRFALALTHPELARSDSFRALAYAFGPAAAETLELERQAVGADHCQVGAYIVGINDMPDCLADTVRHHHHPQSCPETNRKLCALVAVSDQLARFLVAEGDPAECTLPESPEWNILERAGIRADAQQFREAIPDLLTDVLAGLRSDPLASMG